MGLISIGQDCGANLPKKLMSNMAAVTKILLPERFCCTQGYEKYLWLAIYLQGICESKEHFEGT